MNEYRTLSFFTETPCEDFYSYFSLQDLIDKAVLNKEVVLRCRTIGVLQSIHGKFFLSDLNRPVSSRETMVQVSVLYLKNPPPSLVKPYPVQVYGTLQWRNKPVIFAKILQVLNTSNAFRVRNSMKNIAERHQIHPSTT